MGNDCCSNNSNQNKDLNNQVLIYLEPSEGTTDSHKLYNNNSNKNSKLDYEKINFNFTKKIKKQAELISETDFEKILSNLYPSLNNIPFPEQKLNYQNNNFWFSSAIKFPNNEIFKGNFNSKNQRDGLGISISPDGTLFKGNWNCNKIGNFGLFLERTGDYYIGELKDGKFEGKGELEIIGISKYKGEFKNDLMNGKGILNDYENGYIYEGEFLEGKKNGKGVLEYIDGTKYEGEFKDDLYNGYGSIIFSNGNKYEGEFKNGVIKGKGKFIWSDGKKYEGEYNDFIKNGFGTFFWDDNKFYEGQWVNNKQHGKGKISYSGEEKEGIFRYGKIIKEN